MDRDVEWSLGLNIDSGGGTGGEDDDNDSQGGVGILYKNLTSSSSALQGLLRKLGAGLDDLLPSSAMRLASSSHRTRLLTIEYMDLAEQSLQALEDISGASQCLFKGWYTNGCAFLSRFLFFWSSGKFELDNLQRDSNEIANELYRLKEGEEKVNRYVHLLNSTFTAIERITFWILENYHKEDRVEIPKFLRSYMSGKTFIPFQKMSIDLSLEDVKRVALHYGFIFEEWPVDGSSIITVCSPLRGQNDPLLCQSIRGLHYVVDNMLIELLVYQLVSKMKKEMMKTLTVLEKIFGLNVDDFKYEESSPSRLMKRLMASLRQEFSMGKQLYRLGGIPQYSYANIVPTADEFETFDLARTSFASEHHDAVVDNEGPTSTDSVVKETDKPVETEDDKVNQAPSFLKKGEQHEKDVGIEKQSDIAVEEIQPLESIIPGREHDLALMIYKPPPTTPAEYEISDTAILSAFFMPQKNMSAKKNAPAPCSRKPTKIYRSPFLTHFGSSSKGKKKLASNERKKFSFEGYHITGDSPTVEMETFEEWIHDGLYKQHTKKKDDDDHYRVNCSTLEFRQLDFIVAFSKFKNWFYLMYQQNKCWNDEHLDAIMYYLRKKYKNTNFSISRYTTTDYFFKVYIDKAYVNYYNSDVAKDLATQDTSARTDKVPTDWTALKSYEEKFERNPFQVEYLSEIAQQDSGSLDCGVFVAVSTEYLSEGLGIPCLGIDAQYYRLRYSSLLCKYRSEKAENGYFNENDDPPRPRRKFAPKKTDSVLHIK
ncbi:hypothetical protein FXO37_18053 [Capsicum annuum]|nr:hypothetical protein FXO37_18053 [Capsicum annuum]